MAVGLALGQPKRNAVEQDEATLLACPPGLFP